MQWAPSSLWLVAALAIGAVVPITFAVIMPTNRKLLATERDLGSDETRRLLARWARLHALRSLLSAIAALLMVCSRAAV